MTAFLISAIYQSTQMLSFRCFLQFYLPITNNFYSILNYSMCIGTLFVILIMSLCLPVFMTYFRINYCVIFDHVQPKSFVSISYISLEMLMRIFQGFCHAALHLQPFLHMFILGIGYLIFTLILTQSVGCFISKAVTTCIIMRYCVKIVFHLIMILESISISSDG
jgi:hypothetical protein